MSNINCNNDLLSNCENPSIKLEYDNSIKF